MAMFTSLAHEVLDPPVSIGFHTSELGQEQEGLFATACPMPSTALFHFLSGVQCQKLERSSQDGPMPVPPGLYAFLVLSSYTRFGLCDQQHPSEGTVVPL